MTQNLLGQPAMPGAGTELPDDADVRDSLAAGTTPTDVAAAYPARSLPWAVLAEQALDAGQDVAGYAYARVGYHRGLDALRAAGWRGSGPVLWSHTPNQGFLRALAALGRAAEGIDESAEARRCAVFLHDCDPAAAAAIGWPS